MPHRLATIALCATALATSGCLAHHSGALPGEPDATYMEVEGARVRYLDSGGDGPTVLLLHGFASSLGVWAGVQPALSKDHRVVSLDLKGFGWTDRPRGDYSPQAQADLVFALLDELGVQDFAVVAHSWGSSVALAITLAQPERVRRVALYDAWVYEEQLPTFFLWARASSLGELLFWLFYKEQPALKMANAFWDKKYVTQEFVDEVVENLDRPGTRAAALAAVRGQTFELFEQRYPEIQQPVLLLWGREDAVTPLWVGERLTRELPHADLVVYPRCGHFPMIEAASASTSELAEFLARDLPSGQATAAPAPRKPAPAAAEEEVAP
jgi:pimeloyl-ACP methyl ester carboxylesterase